MKSIIHRSPIAIYLLLFALTLFVFRVSHSAFGQGSLTPPGAPAPTMKTLDQVEARTPIGPAASQVTISAPGSYYLAGDIVISGAFGTGISITSGDVTLDLNGFSIRKSAGATNGTGIAVNGPADNSARNLTIRNGHISGPFDGGISLARVHNVTVEDVAIQGMLVNGLFLFPSIRSPSVVTVRRCRVLGEPVDRIVAPPITTTTNTGIDLRFALACLVEDCVVANIAGAGISILTANSGDVTSSGIIRGCVISRCGNNGIDLDVNSSVTRGVLVERCTIDQCGGDGVNTTGATRVVDCVSKSNTGDGFQLFQQALITGCIAEGNGADGIRLATSCQAIGNRANNNGTVDGAGIHVTSTDCILEGNSVAANDRGIDVDNSENLIIKNMATGNTINFDIVANNKVGVIVSAPNSLAISGATGGAGVGSTDPWANLSF